MNEDMYVELPLARYRQGKVAKLKFTLYDMRMAAKNWEAEYTRTLEGHGSEAGKANTCTFYHPEKQASIVAHGGDLTAVCNAAAARWLAGVIKPASRKAPVLGGGRENELVVLSRTQSCIDCSDIF